MAEQHLTEPKLIDVAVGEADRDARDHAAHCSKCGPALEQLRSRLAASARSRARRVTTHRSAFVPLESREPQAGDLWRASWGDHVQLVLVVAFDVEADSVQVAAVAEDAAADARSSAIPEDVLGWKSVALFDVTANLPVRTLELLLGERLPTSPGQVDEPLEDPTDPRQLEHAYVQEQLAWLEDAHWVPDTATGDLTEQLASRWDRPSDLARELAIGNTEARELRRGKRTPTPIEQARLVDLGVDVTGVAPPPAPAIWAADRPRFRSRWMALAGQADEAEADYRWHAYTTEQFALAARKTGADTQRREVWLGRMQELLDGLG
jgi:hypothetical protein